MALDVANDVAVVFRIEHTVKSTLSLRYFTWFTRTVCVSYCFCDVTNLINFSLKNINKYIEGKKLKGNLSWLLYKMLLLLLNNRVNDTKSITWRWRHEHRVTLREITISILDIYMRLPLTALHLINCN